MSLLLKKRVDVLDETVLFLNSLMGEIEFSRMNITDIIFSFSSGEAMKNLSYLNEIHHSDDQYDFHGQWKSSLSSFAYYKSSEKNKMLQLGDFLGTTDMCDQINIIRLYLSFFEKFRSNAVSEYEKYGKISSLLGLFTGASVFILLL